MDSFRAVLTSLLSLLALRNPHAAASSFVHDINLDISYPFPSAVYIGSPKEVVLQLPLRAPAQATQVCVAAMLVEVDVAAAASSAASGIPEPDIPWPGHAVGCATLHSLSSALQ